MAGYDRDEVPMLSDTHPTLVDESLDSQFQAHMSQPRSMSISIPMSSTDGDMNRQDKVDENWKNFFAIWDKFFVVCCLVAIFLDPLFFFLLSVQQDNKCIAIEWNMTKTIVVLRSLTDFVYLLNILLKFRLAYVAPESRVVGAGELVDHPTRIAQNYLKGCFFIDLFVVLPLPQRVNQCLQDACDDTGFGGMCLRFIDCGDGNARNDRNGVGSHPNWESWTKNENATACFSRDSFAYGIYKPTVNLTSEGIITRYVSLFWGFQQISTLAGNQQPSYFVSEVVFIMLIIGLGLFSFAFLIGNMQNYHQALGRRRLELSLRQRDVQQWMSHRRLPQELRRRVLEAERYNWAATKGVNEGMIIENFPEDLQRDIRRHLFKFVNTVWIFALMDRHILDVICERLEQTIYIEGSEILYPGGVVDKMVFIMHGKLESIGDDRTVTPLCEGSVCGEELLNWFLEHASVSKDGKKIKVTGQQLLSNRTVRCLSNVEAFSLRAADLEEFTDLFARSLRNPRIQRAIRYQSPYRRGIVATRIQVAWRYRRRRLRRDNNSEANHPSNS